MGNDEEVVLGFEALMDDDGLLPGDDEFDGPEPSGEGFEEHVVEFDEDGNEVEPDDAGDTPEDEDGEDAGDEGDGEDKPDEGESEPEPEPDTEPQLFDITIDGEEYEVNLPELTAGYLRNEEFVKRSTELESTYAEKIAEAEYKSAELAKELEAAAVIGMADLKQYDTVDWARLKAEDPELYQKSRVEYMDKRDAVQAQMQRKQSIQSMLGKAEEIKQAAYLKSQQELVVKLIPEFHEEGFQPRLTEYAISIGFKPEEIGAIADARQLLVLENARKYAESQLKKKATLQRKPTKELPEVLKPGTKAPVVDNDTKRQRAAVSRLHSEGTIDAAAAAFLDFV